MHLLRAPEACIVAVGCASVRSRDAHRDERRGERDRRAGQSPQRGLLHLREIGGRDRLHRSVVLRDGPGHAVDTAADVPDARGEMTLREAESEREERGEESRQADRPRGSEESGQDRERSPGKREPEVGVEASCKEFEAVGDRGELACRDERADPRSTTAAPTAPIPAANTSEPAPRPASTASGICVFRGRP